ncbi:hypothetical protein KUH03_11030 [Sphingobacterium sp. E70]|uniref:hypothetical protein n=1 Tax=Sphingobacterium sp. E70 TaxID=2853439 RepID=UPI00211CD4AC|nr:hypothetical protein [Sphingobacterium sp. E70]ULT27233.1 hypothetical protein KUH03_11030 [Sphingobacterium sp. E70]
MKVSDRISDKINITLDRLENIIDEVVINKDILRIKLNGDTTEYTVAAMSLGKNDKVGSLLQKLHGITVSDDGTVMVKNKVVSKIYIDGQEYFSYDPRIIVRNVRADAVKKVQVYDEETELTKSTRINDGKKIQVANIILKEEAKKSVFGNVAANYGSKGRYGLALFGGLFNNSRKIGINTSISSLASNEIFVVPKIIGNPETRNYALTYNDELKRTFISIMKSV